VEGQGTTVSIDLPAGPAAAAPAADDPAPAAASDAAGARVLLLDDDPNVRETVGSILSSAGYTVTACATAQEALEEVCEPRPLDLMVVDYAMPSMRGDQFAAEARRRAASPPVLFITGHADPAHLQSERWVLQKPFNAAQLVEMADLARGSAARP
jgi:CheY-like chemotaxis protein